MNEDKTNPEVEKLHREIDRLREILKVSFTLTAEQAERARAWQAAMEVEHPANSGAVGGRFQFIFTPTGIGDCCSVHDSVTGVDLDITDFTDW
jgi:hypothetical protein